MNCLTESEMHMNWVRNSCIEHAIGRNKYRPARDIITEAKEYEKYIANYKKAQTLKMVKDDKKR